MKNTYKIIFLAILLLVLVGCGQGSGGSDINWKTGTEGLSMRFLENGPPNDIYATEKYSLLLELRNLGNFPDKDDGRLQVDLFFSGFDRNLITLRSSDRIFIQGGKTATNREGGLHFYEAEFNARIYDDADSLPQNIVATACYVYKTKASLDVCVVPDPLSRNEGSCRAGVSGGLGSQAAPIAITSVNQENLRGKARYTIRVQNVGSGIVYEGQNCLNPTIMQKDVVYIEGVFLGNRRMSCSPHEKIRLVNGVGTMTCTIDGLDPLEPAFMTSLGVHLVYNYRNSITKNLRIRRLE